jgi:hypothetical protein
VPHKEKVGVIISGLQILIAILERSEKDGSNIEVVE